MIGIGDGMKDRLCSTLLTAWLFCNYCRDLILRSGKPNRHGGSGAAGCFNED